MRLTIPDHDKKKLAAIIQYDRTHGYAQKEPLDWNISDFPVDDGGQTICSPATLSQLENGVVIKDDDIYEGLLHKLGTAYNFKDDLTEKIGTLSSRLLRATDLGDPAGIDAAIAVYREFLSPFADCAIEALLLDALGLIQKAYIDPMYFAGSAEKNTVDRLYALFSVIEDDLQHTLQSILYAHEYEMAAPAQLPDIAKHLKLKDSPSVTAQLAYVHFLMTSRRYYEVPVLLESLSRRSISPLRRLDVLNAQAFFAADTGASNLQTAVTALSDALETTRATLPDKNRASLDYNLGLYYYQLHAPQQALRAWIRNLHTPSYHRIRSANHILMCSTMHGTEIPEETFSAADDLHVLSGSYKEVYETIFRYYRWKKDGAEASRLEAMIQNEMRKLFLLVNDEALYEVFLKELTDLTRKTGHRQLLKNYKRLRRRSAGTSRP